MSCGGAWLALLMGVGGLCIAEMAIYVSKHLAVQEVVSSDSCLQQRTGF